MKFIKSPWNSIKSLWNPIKSLWNPIKTTWNLRKSLWNPIKLPWNLRKLPWNLRKLPGKYGKTGGKKDYKTEVEEYEGTVIYRTLLFYNFVFFGRYEKKVSLSLYANKYNLHINVAFRSLHWHVDPRSLRLRFIGNRAMILLEIGRFFRKWDYFIGNIMIL